MQGKTRGIIFAYLVPASWAVGGFLLAELLRWLAVDRGVQALATAATWLSLLALVAATARALWVSWRLWRNHGGVPPAAGNPP